MHVIGAVIVLRIHVGDKMELFRCFFSQNLGLICPELKTSLAAMKMDDGSITEAKLYLYQQVKL